MPSKSITLELILHSETSFVPGCESGDDLRLKDRNEVWRQQDRQVAGIYRRDLGHRSCKDVLH